MSALTRREFVKAAGALVHRHPERRGKGIALQSGLAWARAHGFTHVFTVDGDGQHLADEMPILLDAAGGVVCELAGPPP